MSMTLELRVRNANNTYSATHRGKTATATSGAEQVVRALLRKLYPAHLHLVAVAKVEAAGHHQQGGAWIHTMRVEIPDGEEVRQAPDAWGFAANAVDIARPRLRAAVASSADPPQPPAENASGVSDTCQSAKSGRFELAFRLAVSVELAGYPQSRFRKSEVLDIQAGVDPLGKHFFGVDLFGMIKAVDREFRPFLERKLASLEARQAKRKTAKRGGRRR